ncbi:Ankyrin repeat domain-containing protein OS=Castellaniella defragrans OX=75697 GN=HNR28_003597 PE=4 SV=1 [Castellaniella defragrans]
MNKIHTALARLRIWLPAFLVGAPLLAGGLAWGQQAPGADWWSAIGRDDVSAVTGQLLRGVDPNAFSKIGNPALTQAVRDHSWKVFDTLSTTPGVRVDEPNAHNETPLMYLCIEGQTQRAEALIAAGAQVNRLGWTPLHYAASKARLDTAKMLLARHAIVNAPGPDGTTPLMMAALSGSQDMVNLLLSQGADPTMFNLAHETAADFARRRDHAALAQSLDEAAARKTAERQLGADSNGAEKPPSAAPVPPPAETPGQTPGQAPRQSPQQVPQGASGAQAPGSSDDKSSFSRYFDPGRFDQPAR